jgi:hypothetical protein
MLIPAQNPLVKSGDLSPNCPKISIALKFPPIRGLERYRLLLLTSD